MFLNKFPTIEEAMRIGFNLLIPKVFSKEKKTFDGGVE